MISVAGVHDERTVARDGLVEGAAPEDQHVPAFRGVARLVRRAFDCDRLARPEDGQFAFLHVDPLRAQRCRRR